MIEKDGRNECRKNHSDYCAVLDIKFSEGKLPEINEAIDVPLKNGGKLVVEVSQHLGDDTVRCIAMGSTDGLIREWMHMQPDQQFWFQLEKIRLTYVQCIGKSN